MLSGILKCPVCGAGMYGNKTTKRRADGTSYKDYFFYCCKHRKMLRGHKCDFNKQVNEEQLDEAVSEILKTIKKKPKFTDKLREKIDTKIDLKEIEDEIANYEKQFRQAQMTKSHIIDDIDSLDPDEKHYINMKSDLDNRLYKMYDRIENLENILIDLKARKQTIEAEKVTSDNIYDFLLNFDNLFEMLNKQEKRRLFEAMLSEVQIYENRQPNGQWIKSVKFKVPIIDETFDLSWDNESHVETVCLLSRKL